ncbi:MOSC domain-containing protein [Terrabacter sp. GCM10028922]|uniref:MOSC domain-containing protein n=1 Tax=Terrabacter sp. GCM10028922 TaxID=3273428 RepID=UPI003614A216
MSIGTTVARLSVTPVKGLLLHHPDSIELTAQGAVGDRQFYLVDDTGKVQSFTHNPGLAGVRAEYDPASRRLRVTRGDQVLLGGDIEPTTMVVTDMWGLRTIRSDVVADPVWGTFFSDLVGRRVHLVQARESAYDVRPVTLLGTSSVEELARQANRSRVDSRRFRMLIEFSGGEPHLEDSWDGKVLEVGHAVLRGGGPVKRCAATTRNPDSGAVDLQTLRLITSYRGRRDSVLGVGATFGVYADVIEPGRICVGDCMTVRTDT